MADATQNFTDMFKKLGEQLKVPAFDMSKMMEHHQKNLDAMTRSWQAMAGGANEIAVEADAKSSRPPSRTSRRWRSPTSRAAIRRK